MQRIGSRKKTATTTLYCAVNARELEAIKSLRWKSFPPPEEDEAGFYPALNETFALQKARDLTSIDWGSGFVIRFCIAAVYVRCFEVQTLSGEVHEELWVPAEEMAHFNRNIVGKIRLVKMLSPETAGPNV